MEQKNNMKQSKFVKVEFLYNIDLNNLREDKETGEYKILAYWSK